MHPHTGLQTVSWLFTGEIEHRDTAGHHAVVRPGELNLMTAGHGIAHSEVSTASTTTLHGVQLWIILPQHDAHGSRAFEHFVPMPATIGPATVRVFLGTLAGVYSPVRTATPLLGAEVLLPANTVWHVPVDPAHEHAALIDTGIIRFRGQLARRGTLAIREQRAEWMARSDRFGMVTGYEPVGPSGAKWQPEPDLPAITLRPGRR